jgi:hypothetical protein
MHQMKKIKYFLLTMIMFLFTFTGCESEKIITIPSPHIEILYITTYSIISSHLTNAQVNLDFDNKIISYSNNENLKYPENLNLAFSLNENQTEVLAKSTELDQDKFENLEKLFKDSYQNIFNIYKPTSITDSPSMRMDL